MAIGGKGAFRRYSGPPARPRDCKSTLKTRRAIWYQTTDLSDDTRHLLHREGRREGGRKSPWVCSSAGGEVRGARSLSALAQRSLLAF